MQPSKNRIYAQRIVLGAAACGITAVLLLFAVHAYPVPIGDATHFIPPVLNKLHGRELSNILWPLLRAALNDTGSSHFVGHGFLYQLYLGAVATPHLPHLYLGQAAVSGAVLLCTLLLFFRALNNRAAAHRDTALIAASLLGMATHLTVFGRPDALAELFVLLGVLAAIYAPYAWLRLLLPLMLALAAVSSVTVPAFALPIIAMFVSTRFGFHRALGEMLLMTVLPAVIVVLLVKLLYPFRLEEWANGIVHHAEAALRSLSDSRQSGKSVFDLTSIRYYWVVNPGRTGYGIAVLVSLQLAASYFWRTRAQIRCPSMFWLSFAVLLGVLVLLTIVEAKSSYRFLPFMPLVYVVLFLSSWQTRSPAKIEYLLPLALCLLTAVGFVRQAALFPFFIAKGVSFDEARRDFERLEPQLGPKIAVTGSLWTLGSRISRFRKARVTPGGALAEVSGPSAALVQQQYSASTNAPRLKGYRKIFDSFVPDSPAVLGIRLGTSVPGYQFAAYVPAGASR